MHTIAARLWLGSKQARRDADTTTRARNPEMDASSIAEEVRNLSAANAAKNTAGNMSTKNSRVSWCNSGEQGGELEHVVPCDGRCGRHKRERWDWESSGTRVGHTDARAERTLYGDDFTRRCVSNGPSGCTFESPRCNE